ncbi:hypothetical protein DFP72DRAFT_1079871 [Ephemerocybe angulata]|uniref:Uncharacterized protein n=1 Tax=Ephemerocybe angulata TaxID=980116 RepID=A0A8H6HC89_9AGAR|nr:hypothetical protein DFP72DRAFT_1079871 [Tulosesus angulatus]
MSPSKSTQVQPLKSALAPEDPLQAVRTRSGLLNNALKAACTWQAPAEPSMAQKFLSDRLAYLTLLTDQLVEAIKKVGPNKPTFAEMNVTARVTEWMKEAKKFKRQPGAALDLSLFRQPPYLPTDRQAPVVAATKPEGSDNRPDPKGKGRETEPEADPTDGEESRSDEGGYQEEENLWQPAENNEGEEGTESEEDDEYDEGEDGDEDEASMDVDNASTSTDKKRKKPSTGAVPPKAKRVKVGPATETLPVQREPVPPVYDENSYTWIKRKAVFDTPCNVCGPLKQTCYVETAKDGRLNPNISCSACKTRKGKCAKSIRPRGGERAATAPAPPVAPAVVRNPTAAVASGSGAGGSKGSGGKAGKAAGQGKATRQTQPVREPSWEDLYSPAGTLTLYSPCGKFKLAQTGMAAMGAPIRHQADRSSKSLPVGGPSGGAPSVGAADGPPSVGPVTPDRKPSGGRHASGGNPSGAVHVSGGSPSVAGPSVATVKPRPKPVRKPPWQNTSGIVKAVNGAADGISPLTERVGVLEAEVQELKGVDDCDGKTVAQKVRHLDIKIDNVSVMHVGAISSLKDRVKALEELMETEESSSEEESEEEEGEMSEVQESVTSLEIGLKELGRRVVLLEERLKQADQRSAARTEALAAKLRAESAQMEKAWQAKFEDVMQQCRSMEEERKSFLAVFSELKGQKQGKKEDSGPVSEKAGSSRRTDGRVGEGGRTEEDGRVGAHVAAGGRTVEDGRVEAHVAAGGRPAEDGREEAMVAGGGPPEKDGVPGGGPLDDKMDEDRTEASGLGGRVEGQEVPAIPQEMADSTATSEVQMQVEEAEEAAGDKVLGTEGAQEPSTSKAPGVHTAEEDEELESLSPLTELGEVAEVKEDGGAVEEGDKSDRKGKKRARSVAPKSRFPPGRVVKVPGKSAASTPPAA